MRRVQYEESFGSEVAWAARAGSLTWHNNYWTLIGDPAGEAHFCAYPLNRVGGNVRIDFHFTVTDLTDDARLRLAVNDFRLLIDERAPDPIESRDVEDSLTFADGQSVLRMQHTRQPIDWQPEVGRVHQLTFIQLGRHKQIWIDGQRRMTLDVTTPWVCSEGDVLIEAAGATLSLTDFKITEIDWDEPRRDYVKGEQLYADDFADPEVVDRWTYEYRGGEWGLPPILDDGWLHVERTSVAWTKQRFEGPVIFSFDMLPIPESEDRPESIADAIFMFNADVYGSDEGFLDRPHYSYPLAVSDWLDAYWIDFGGNYNTNTRLRRQPYRFLLCHSIRPEDVLMPEHIHRIKIIAADPDVRFVVDGRTVLSFIDRDFKTGGHFGLLGFVRPTRIRNFQVHRAVLER